MINLVLASEVERIGWANAHSRCERLRARGVAQLIEAARLQDWFASLQGDRSPTPLWEKIFTFVMIDTPRAGRTIAIWVVARLRDTIPFESIAAYLAVVLARYGPALRYA